MRRRRVLIDSSFISAVLEPSDPCHGAARSRFERLLLEFERGTTALYTSAAVLTDVPDRRVADLVRVCEVAPVRRWVSREAERVVREHPQVDRRRAIDLVLMARLQIGEIASFDPFFEQHAIPTVSY